MCMCVSYLSGVKLCVLWVLVFLMQVYMSIDTHGLQWIDLLVSDMIDISDVHIDYYHHHYYYGYYYYCSLSSSSSSSSPYYYYYCYHPHLCVLFFHIFFLRTGIAGDPPPPPLVQQGAYTHPRYPAFERGWGHGVQRSRF